MSTASAAPSTCAACGEAASTTLKLKKCTACAAVAYCGRACQVSHWKQHKLGCQDSIAMRVAAALRETGHATLQQASSRGDLAAVRILSTAGANFGMGDARGNLPIHAAAERGRSEVVRYLATRTPKNLIDSPNNDGLSPLMLAAADTIDAESVLRGILGRAAIYRHPRQDNRETVRVLARLGCDLTRRTQYGETARHIAHRSAGGTVMATERTSEAQPMTGADRLLTDIESAGGWRQYVTAQRMAYVRIRHTVSKTYKVLYEGHDDRELFHFVFGRNRVAEPKKAWAKKRSAKQRAALRKKPTSKKPAAAGDPKQPLLVLPWELFIELCKWLE